MKQPNECPMARWLKSLCLRMGWNIAYLADFLGLPDTFVSKCMSGILPPPEQVAVLECVLDLKEGTFYDVCRQWARSERS